jgi:spore maturation protein SpmA
MLNLIWLILILGGIVAAAFNGRIDLVTESFFRIIIMNSIISSS